MKNALDVLTSWTEALLAERTEERSKLASSLAESSLKQRRAEGMSWSPVEVTDASFAFGGAKWNVICGEGGGIPGAFQDAPRTGASQGIQRALQIGVCWWMGSVVEVWLRCG